MKEPGEELRNAVFVALKDAVTVATVTPKVFNPRLDTSPGNYYFIISQEGGKQEDSKESDVRRHSVELQAVTKFGPYEGGFSIANSMIRQASEIINGGIELDLGAEFSIIYTRQEEMTTSVDLQTPVESIFTKIIRFEFLININ